MELKDRIASFVTYSGKKLSELSRYAGFKTPQALRELMAGNTKTLSDAALQKITTAYPEINPDWLCTGEGEMLKPEIENSEADETADETIIETTNEEEEIPEKFMSYLVPMAAMGGSLVGFEEEGVMRENCERVISPIANIDLVVPVCGESMEPEYPNGSKVYVRRINPDDFIAWGNVYVLDTTNGIIIKVVVESERENCVRCVSLNPSGRYTPFDVPKRTIRAMYRVMLCVSVK